MSIFNPCILNSASVLARENRSLRVGKIRGARSIMKLASSTIRAEIRLREFSVSNRLFDRLAVWYLTKFGPLGCARIGVAPEYVSARKTTHIREVVNG